MTAEPRDYCMTCGTTQPVKSQRFPSGTEWRCAVCNAQTDFDHDEDYDDYSEAVGSCENCGTNLYADDDPELCDQCLFYAAERSDE